MARWRKKPRISGTKNITIAAIARLINELVAFLISSSLEPITAFPKSTIPNIINNKGKITKKIRNKA